VNERNHIVIEDVVVQKLAGIAAQEVDGIQMGGGGGVTRGVSVQVGEEEAAVYLSLAVEYGKAIPQLTDAVRRNVISRVEEQTGLRVPEVNITVYDALLAEERAQLDRQHEVQWEAQRQDVGTATPGVASGVNTPGPARTEPPAP
jgi:uncharacterized alkaline shock family protein YloU